MECYPHVYAQVINGALYPLYPDNKLYIFPLSALKRGSWVVERVVGPGELRTPDDSLREQLKKLQITREIQMTFIT